MEYTIKVSFTSLLVLCAFRSHIFYDDNKINVRLILYETKKTCSIIVRSERTFIYDNDKSNNER